MKLTQKPTEVRGTRRFVLVAVCAALGLATCASALTLRLPVNSLIAAANTDDKGASVAPDSLSVPGPEMASLVLTKKNPVYPVEAKKQRIQGTVKLDAVISKEGKIEDLTVVSGPPELQQSSLDAVREWTYKPYLLNGDPVEVKTTITVIYSLAK